jgi:hypothetical protein
VRLQNLNKQTIVNPNRKTDAQAITELTVGLATYCQCLSQRSGPFQRGVAPPIVSPPWRGVAGTLRGLSPAHVLDQHYGLNIRRVAVLWEAKHNN